MKRELSELLKEGIERIDSSLYNSSLFFKLEKLFDEIMLFNPVYKLVACDERELVVKHLLDCLAPAAIIRKHSEGAETFADLGSGAGLPGIVLASAMPDYGFTLVERMGRRAGFLRNTVALTGMAERTEIIQSDLSELNRQFDAVTFRAFRRMKDIASDLERITHKGSVIFAYKSNEDDMENELKDLEKICPAVFCSEIVPYNVPFLNAPRNLLIITRIS